MRPEDRVRLQHLTDAATTAQRFVEAHTRADLDTDDMLRLALTKLIEIVGEAAKQISDEGRAHYPDVPWPAAARMRDRLVHHYFDIDLDILWSTATEDLPALVRRISDRREMTAE